MGFRRAVLSTSSKIYAGRLGGAALVFVSQALIARLWGAEILGEYLLIVATVNIVSVLMPLGFETVGTYFAAEYRAKGEGRLLRRFMLRAHIHVGIATVVLYLAGTMALGHFGEPGRVLLAFWEPTCMMAVANALILVNSALMVGLKHPYAGFFADSVFRPILIVGALGLTILLLAPEEAFGALIWIMGAGYLGIAFVHLGYALGVVRREVEITATPRPQEARRWWRFAVPWAVIVLATDFFFDVDLILLAGLMSKEELAIFGVCTRIFALVSFGVTAVYAVTLPDMFESEARSDRAGFIRKVGDANLVASTFAVVMFVGVAVAAPLALMLFGPDFSVGHLPLTVLSLALVVRALFGPTALLISINDRPYATLPAVALGTVTLIVANLALVPPFGLTGAASAVLIAQGVWSLSMWLTAMRITRVDVSILPRLRDMLQARRDAAAKDA
ncbi:MAG TPA: oligosaccharide flippase family protein [Alphaproteobacteria bacterium]|nr:oligosaccharide flippase family protein [Alphaproteobacteria bacterium]